MRCCTGYSVLTGNERQLVDTPETKRSHVHVLQGQDLGFIHLYTKSNDGPTL